MSYDYGETWTRLNNLPVGQFTILAVDSADPYNIVGGLQDNGVMRGPSTYRYGKTDPQAWKSIYGGDGSCVVIDPKDPNVVYAALQFGIAARLNVKTGERASIRPRPELSAKKKEKPLRYNWITPFLLSPHSRDILYFGTNRLYRSFDRGDTWTAISEDLTSNPEQGDVPFGTITSISESPKKFGVIYAGTDEGKVWGTRDGGATWTDLSKGLARDRWVTRVLASSFDEGTVYATQSGYRNDEFAPYVFRSTDYGKTWQSLAAGLPAEPVNVIREDPKAKHLLYLGTDSGVFVSLDRGDDLDGDDRRPPARGRPGPRRRAALGRPRRRNARPERLHRGGGAPAQAEGGRRLGRPPRLPRQADQGESPPRIRRRPVDPLLPHRTVRPDRLLGRGRRAGQARREGRERHALEGAGRDLAVEG